MDDKTKDADKSIIEKAIEQVTNAAGMVVAAAQSAAEATLPVEITIKRRKATAKKRPKRKTKSAARKKRPTKKTKKSKTAKRKRAMRP